MGFVETFRNFFGVEPKEYEYEYENEEYDDEVEEEPARGSRGRSSYARQKSRNDEKVVSIHSNIAGGRIKVIKPMNESSAIQIADEIKARRMVIINLIELAQINANEAQSIVNFIAGAAYAVDGDIKKIADNIFVATPTNLDVDGESIGIKNKKNKRNWDKF